MSNLRVHDACIVFKETGGLFVLISSDLIHREMNHFDVCTWCSINNKSVLESLSTEIPYQYEKY